MYECRNEHCASASNVMLKHRDGVAARADEEFVSDFDSFAGRRAFAAPKDAVAFARRSAIRRTHKFTDAVLWSRSTPWRWRPIPAVGPGGHLRPFRPAGGTPEARFPLDAAQPSSRARTHSIHDNQPLLARIEPRRQVWMKHRRTPTNAALERRREYALQRPRLDGAAGEGHEPHRARRGLDQAGALGLSRAYGADTIAGATRRPRILLGALRRHDLQYQSVEVERAV